MATNSTSITTAERRKNVLLGDLPTDFLRVGCSDCSNEPTSQLNQDEMTALVLAQERALLQANSFIPAGTRGRLAITIVEAKLAKNYGLIRMDPYCRLRVGNSVFETPTNVKGGKAPKWNRTVHCYLPQGVETIFAELFDERAFTVDERIAWAYVTIPPAVFDSEISEDWYQLSGQQGEGKEGLLQLVISFSPVESPIQRTLQNPANEQVNSSETVLFTEKDVQELGEMFPGIESDVIVCVLDEERGNKDATINALLQMVQED